MAKIIGCFVGAALTLVALIAMFGLPERAVPPLGIDVAENPLPSDVIAPPLAQPATSVENIQPQATAEENKTPAPVELSVPHDSGGVSNGMADVTHEATPQWHAFWTPFRSQLAADGFMQQLQRTTGLDYRVVKQQAGAYEVAFAYLNDTERADNLSIISAATGLELPES